MLCTFCFVLVLNTCVLCMHWVWDTVCCWEHDICEVMHWVLDTFMLCNTWYSFCYALNFGHLMIWNIWYTYSFSYAQKFWIHCVQYMYCCRPQKGKPYVMNLIPCIIHIARRTEEPVLETLAAAMPKIFKALGNFTSDNDVKVCRNCRYMLYAFAISNDITRYFSPPPPLNAFHVCKIYKLIEV